MLQISKGLSIPLQAVTHTAAILAMRGAGKSNTAVVVAEEMYDKGIPFVAIDPKGDWWGIRSSASGKGSGLSIPIFGGLHADLPLDARSGALIADLIVEHKLSCVLDVSEFDSKAEQVRFLTEFAQRLFRLKAKHTFPLHLFLEEADDYIPQKVFTNLAQCVGAFSKIVKQGRSRGLGATLITQRSAVINKDVLTQVDTLIPMRITAPQDRKAILGWVEHHALGKEIVDSLPNLNDGEAWVWSPQFLKVLEKIQVRRRRTFDSGATPELGEVAKAATLADINLEALSSKLEATVEKIKADDPKELRRRIAELERELRSRPPEERIVEKRVEIPVNIIPEEIPEQLSSIDEALRAVGRAISDLIPTTKAGIATVAPRSKLEIASRTSPPSSKPPGNAERRGSGQEPPSPPLSQGITRPQQRILDALAWLESVGISEAKKVQLALLAEQSPKSSGYANNLGALKSAGLIVYPSGGLVALTDGGRGIAQAPSRPPTTEDLHDSLFARLPRPQVRILQALIAEHPNALPKDDLAHKAEQSPTSSGFANNLGSLRSLGFIDYPAPGHVAAREVLFLES